MISGLALSYCLEEISLTPAAVFTDVFPCPIPASPCTLTDTIDEDEVTGTVKLQYDLNESVNLYASIDRGYRPGAANFDIDGSFSPEFNSYAGETVDSFEIGVKGDLMDGRARYTAAVFYGRYDDYQVPVNFEAYNTVTETSSSHHQCAVCERRRGRAKRRGG